MRVLLAADWAGGLGGEEAYLEQLRSGLEGAGHEVRLLVSGAGDGRGRADVVVPPLRGAAAQAAGQLVNPRAVLALRRAVASFRPEVVNVATFALQLSPAAVLAAGRPVVVTVSWPKPVCPTGHKLLPGGTICTSPWGRVCVSSGCVSRVRWARELPRYRLVAAALRSAATVLTCSEDMRRRLAGEGIDAQYVPWPVLPPGPGFRRTPSSRPLFVAAGRLSPEKGLDTLLRALAILRQRGVDARVRLIGDGPERDTLGRLAGSLGVADAVELVGSVPHAVVERHLADAWALVAPSRWAEPLGLTAIEAIVRGVPVVASAVGGYAETVEPGVTGLLVRNGDAAALARCLEEVSSRRAFPTLAVPAASAEALLLRHDVGVHVARMEAVFEEVAR